MLKKLIKELPSLVPTDDNGGTGGNESNSRDNTTSTNTNISANDTTTTSAEENKRGSPSPTGGAIAASSSKNRISQANETNLTKAKVMGESPGEIAFFKLLHAELKKASHFFERAQVEFSIREERVREGMDIMKQPNSIMVNEKWSCLAKSIYRLYKDLLLLETFAIMTYCSFSKILKKHDKVTGYKTRNAFMANVVNKANFTNYPKVSGMIKRCESLYDEVSQTLVEEGNSSLCEDERLFINMIHRLNGQIMDKAEEEGAPDTEMKKEHNNRRQNLAVPASSLSPKSKDQSASQAASSLRSLVEENDTKPETNSACLSDDDDDDDINSTTDIKAESKSHRDEAINDSDSNMTLVGKKRGIEIHSADFMNKRVCPS